MNRRVTISYIKRQIIVEPQQGTAVTVEVKQPRVDVSSVGAQGPPGPASTPPDPGDLAALFQSS